VGVSAQPVADSIKLSKTHSLDWQRQRRVQDCGQQGGVQTVGSPQEQAWHELWDHGESSEILLSERNTGQGGWSETGLSVRGCSKNRWYCRGGLRWCLKSGSEHILVTILSWKAASTWWNIFTTLHSLHVYTKMVSWCKLHENDDILLATMSVFSTTARIITLKLSIGLLCFKVFKTVVILTGCDWMFLHIYKGIILNFFTIWSFQSLIFYWMFYTSALYAKHTVVIWMLRNTLLIGSRLYISTLLYQIVTISTVVSVLLHIIVWDQEFNQIQFISSV